MTNHHDHDSKNIASDPELSILTCESTDQLSLSVTNLNVLQNELHLDSLPKENSSDDGQTSCDHLSSEQASPRLSASPCSEKAQIEVVSKSKQFRFAETIIDDSSRDYEPLPRDTRPKKSALRKTETASHSDSETEELGEDQKLQLALYHAYRENQPSNPKDFRYRFAKHDQTYRTRLSNESRIANNRYRHALTQANLKANPEQSLDMIFEIPESVSLPSQINQDWFSALVQKGLITAIDLDQLHSLSSKSWRKLQRCLHNDEMKSLIESGLLNFVDLCNLAVTSNNVAHLVASPVKLAALSLRVISPGQLAYEDDEINKLVFAYLKTLSRDQLKKSLTDYVLDFLNQLPNSHQFSSLLVRKNTGYVDEFSRSKSDIRSFSSNNIIQPIKLGPLPQFLVMQKRMKRMAFEKELTSIVSKRVFRQTSWSSHFWVWLTGQQDLKAMMVTKIAQEIDGKVDAYINLNPHSDLSNRIAKDYVEKICTKLYVRLNKLVNQKNSYFNDLSLLSVIVNDDFLPKKMKRNRSVNIKTTYNPMHRMIKNQPLSKAEVFDSQVDQMLSFFISNSRLPKELTGDLKTMIFQEGLTSSQRFGYLLALNSDYKRNLLPHLTKKHDARLMQSLHLMHGFDAAYNFTMDNYHVDIDSRQRRACVNNISALFIYHNLLISNVSHQFFLGEVHLTSNNNKYEILKLLENSYRESSSNVDIGKRLNHSLNEAKSLRINFIVQQSWNDYLLKNHCPSSDEWNDFQPISQTLNKDSNAASSLLQLCDDKIKQHQKRKPWSSWKVYTIAFLTFPVSIFVLPCLSYGSDPYLLYGDKAEERHKTSMSFLLGLKKSINTRIEQDDFLASLKGRPQHHTFSAFHQSSRNCNEYKSNAIRSIACQPNPVSL